MQAHSNQLLELTEIKLRRMQDLKKQVKELSAELSMLQDDVIENYFKTSPEYKTARGLVLATYTTYKEKRFSKDLFDKENPGIYELYKVEGTATRFTLK